MPSQVNAQLEEMATILKDAVNKVFEKNGKQPFSEEPTVHKNNIIEYNHRMRASGIDKFNMPAHNRGCSFLSYPKRPD